MRWRSCSILVLFSFELVLFRFEAADCCEEEISKLRLTSFDSFYSPLIDCMIGGVGGICDFVLLLCFKRNCCCELHSVSILLVYFFPVCCIIVSSIGNAGDTVENGRERAREQSVGWKHSRERFFSVSFQINFFSFQFFWFIEFAKNNANTKRN